MGTSANTGFEAVFLGGAGEVGRSSVLINGDLLIDYGIKPTNPVTFPKEDVYLRPKSVIISHGHLDHCGLIPNLMDLNPDVICTPMTAKLTALLARDVLKIAEGRGQTIPFYEEEIVDFERKVKPRVYNQMFKTNGYTGCFYDAGHIPGSSMVRLEKNDKSLFYTGDLNIINTELQNGANVAFPENDILMIESTYWERNHTPRNQLEKRFIESVRETLDISGKVIIPAFSIGRTQEIMLILRKYNIPVFVDGMGREVCKMIRRFPDCVSSIRAFEDAYKGSTMVTTRTRENVLSEPGVVVTSAGMLNGGPVLYYMDCISEDRRSKIMLTGYQAEGTNGRMVIEKKGVEGENGWMNLKCHVEHFDFSAHIDDVHLKETVKGFCDRGAEAVIAIHGDRTDEFANWIETDIGVDAYAPKVGDRIRIE